MYWHWDNLVLTGLQAACVALPAAGLPLALERFRRGWWALVLPLSIALTIAVLELFPTSPDVYTWAALVLVPVGAALALGWAARGARPALALLALPLFAVAWAVEDAWTGEVAAVLLITGSAVTLGRLLASSAPLPLLKAGLVAMAVVDAVLVFGGTLEAPANRLNAAIPAPGLPQLQSGSFSGFSLGYGDFLAAAVLGGIAAVQHGPAIRLALALFVASLAWDQLFLVTNILPATVPPALVLLAWDGFNRPMLRRRLLPTAVLLAFLTIVAGARAAAGGGSSGFGGGGGGGGGFSGGGGSGTSGSLPPGVWVLLIFGALVFFGWSAYTASRLRKRRQERAHAVQLASAEAAADDEAFDADTVRAAADRLFRDVQGAWDARDRDRLAELIGADLHKEWCRRLDDFDAKGWHNRVKLHGPPEVEYLALTNRAEDADDRVTVRISATLDDYVVTRTGSRVKRNTSSSEQTALCEYWTLAKRDGRWTLLSIEADAEGHHHLESAIVASPWGDDERLGQAAVAERVAAEGGAPAIAPGELADLDFAGPARAAAMDLALADPRFDVDLIEASVQRAVAAWAEAVDGDDAALEAAARPDAVAHLLHPGDAERRKTRLVVRGPRIDKVTIAALDAAAEPPSLTVHVAVTGRRYVEDRDTAAVVSGSKEAAASFTERWVLALDGEGDWPWRIAAATVAAA